MICRHYFYSITFDTWRTCMDLGGKLDFENQDFSRGAAKVNSQGRKPLEPEANTVSPVRGES